MHQVNVGHTMVQSHGPVAQTNGSTSFTTTKPNNALETNKTFRAEAALDSQNLLHQITV